MAPPRDSVACRRRCIGPVHLPLHTSTAAITGTSIAQITIRGCTNTGPDDPLLSLSASSTTNNQLIDETTVGSAIILQDTADWTSAICKHFILDGTAQDAHRGITYG